ncbi:MAG: hypothetical protein NTY45_06475, partial [Elusimicrobia bacterium]|nr:hypothetical protein [Elusimicrobiota bacterium]
MLRKQIPFIPLGIFSGPQVLPNGRIFIPTGPPMYINSLSTVKKSVQTPLPFPDYAQVVVRSHSDRVNKDYTPEELGDYVHGGRCVQTSTDSAAVTVIAQTGIYNGESAGSVQLIFGYNKSDREPGFKDFAG